MKNSIVGSIALLAWKLLEFYGKDPAPCFAASGLSKAQLENSATRVKIKDFDDIWECVQQTIPDPCAGLNAVQFWHPATMGVLGYAMLSSSSLRESLQRLVRYQNVVMGDSQFIISEADKGLVLKQEHFRHQSKEFPLEVDVTIALLLHICRFNSSDPLDPVEVNLMRSRPECAGRYFAFYRCPVNFSAEFNNIILPLEAMDKPLPSTNLHLAQMHDRVLQNYLAEQQRSELISRVREAIIAHLPSGEANKDKIAKSLLMSTRTMQRRLQEEGSNFVDTLNETRQELAIQYIQDDNMPLKEVSYLLGFSDGASFSRAFKRWTGRRPVEVRTSVK